MATVVSTKRAFPALLLALVLLMPGWASAQTSFSQIVVFGDSLSDPGNAFIFQGTANVPPYDSLDQLLVPTMSYAKGGHHFSNGATWIEQLARQYALSKSTRPAFDELGLDATNYAIGGARARDREKEDITKPEKFATLPNEVAAFLQVFGGNAPKDALYVVEFGSNDIRDALMAPDPLMAPMIIGMALRSVHANIELLYGAGARKFLVCSAPDLSLTPAIMTTETMMPGAARAARELSIGYNSGLNNVVTSLRKEYPEIQVVQVDFFGKLVEMVKNPADFGLSVIDTPCVTPWAAPFACSNPDDYLFWDGIHPTQVVHSIIAQQALSELAK